jgi:hypothetical protein
MGKSKILVSLILIIVSSAGFSQSSWVLRKEKDGIFVYDLKTDTSKFNSIKVETELNGRVEDLISLLMDVGSHKDWAYGTKSATVLKRLSDREIIFYKVINSPGLVVSDRDVVIRLKIMRDPGTKTVNVKSVAVPDYIPPKQNLVRVPLSNEIWTIVPLPNQKIRIHYLLQVDPGGALPPLLVNMFVARGPFETFSNLRDLLKKRAGS